MKSIAELENVEKCFEFPAQNKKNEESVVFFLQVREIVKGTDILSFLKVTT
jgi:hypothetical protein